MVLYSSQKYMLASQLNKNAVHPGLISPQAYNAIGTALQDSLPNQSGFVEHATRQSATSTKTKSRRYIRFTCETNLVQRSIFGINNLAPYNDPCIVNAVNINAETNATQYGLFTNIQPYNTADGYGLCKPIDYYEPVLLFVSDDTFFPLCGMPCGPDNDTDNWGISGFNAYGLICISNPSDDPHTLNNVWCIRAPSLNLCGVLLQDITPWQGGGKPLSYGNLQIQYRIGSGANTLVNATGPNESDLILPVFNTSTSTKYKTGAFVKCIAVSGVGLVIIDAGSSLIKGRAKQNIGHYNAGLVNIYTGNPGTETWDGETSYLAFNQLNEIVANEWVFLTPSGSNNTNTNQQGSAPYYIVNSEYSGKILGQVLSNVDGGSESTVEVQIYAGNPGAEIDIGETITANLGFFIGAIPANSWVICNFVASDVSDESTSDNPDGDGYWQIVATQRGNSFCAQVVVGQANAETGYAPVDDSVLVNLLIGVEPELTEPPFAVYAFVQYAPVCDNELVHIEWNGNIFIITKGELDGGFYAVAQQEQINNGSTGTVAMKPMANSEVLVSSLQVDTQEGNVEQGRTVYICRNRAGFHIVSKSCS